MTSQTAPKTFISYAWTNPSNQLRVRHLVDQLRQDGVDALLDTPIVAHTCDNPLCQNPEHWRASNHYLNGREYANRRHTIGTPLADKRGARGRAHEIRSAARNGQPIAEAVLAGLPLTHRDQPALFTTQLAPVLDLNDTMLE